MALGWLALWAALCPRADSSELHFTRSSLWLPLHRICVGFPTAPATLAAHGWKAAGERSHDLAVSPSPPTTRAHLTLHVDELDAMLHPSPSAGLLDLASLPRANSEPDSGNAARRMPHLSLLPNATRSGHVFTRFSDAFWYGRDVLKDVGSWWFCLRRNETTARTTSARHSMSAIRIRAAFVEWRCDFAPRSCFSWFVEQLYLYYATVHAHGEARGVVDLHRVRSTFGCLFCVIGHLHAWHRMRPTSRRAERRALPWRPDDLTLARLSTSIHFLGACTFCFVKHHVAAVVAPSFLFAFLTRDIVRLSCISLIAAPYVVAHVFYMAFRALGFALLLALDFLFAPLLRFACHVAAVGCICTTLFIDVIRGVVARLIATVMWSAVRPCAASFFNVARAPWRLLFRLAHFSLVHSSEATDRYSFEIGVLHRMRHGSPKGKLSPSPPSLTGCLPPLRPSQWCRALGLARASGLSYRDLLAAWLWQVAFCISLASGSLFGRIVGKHTLVDQFLLDRATLVTGTVKPVGSGFITSR